MFRILMGKDRATLCQNVGHTRMACLRRRGAAVEAVKATAVSVR